VTVWYRSPEILLGTVEYSLPVDIWSCGCIIAEMATLSPLFPGDSEIGTIFKIFKKLGTPSAAQWPSLEKLPDMKKTFPQWTFKGWDSINRLNEVLGQDGIRVVATCLDYDPEKRISARRALQLPYFN